ncbi:hypothetical protein [Streptomyces avicenniae]|uniref:hypothetical protein n=1 Tax=Streptomyces avicenniae TaxID=500153 RepID=UPI00069A18F3|nr:hypothetical protein [Streptomyces avicenniae]
MPRTERERRRRIADAATDLRLHPAAVLYLCAPEVAPEWLIARLQAHAGARSLAVADTVMDLMDPASPMDDRPGWQHVRELVLAREVTAVVTADGGMCGGTPGERAAVHAWLADHASELTAAPVPVARV